MIEVRRISEGGPLSFEVVVREGAGETRHHLTMCREICERLMAGKHTPERLRRPSVCWGKPAQRNAAVNPVFGPLAKLTDEAFDKIMGANVTATIWFANLVCPGRRGCPAQGRHDGLC